MEHCNDIAHLAHVEMLTDRFEESLDFFTRVYGLKLSGQDATSAYLRNGVHIETGPHKHAVQGTFFLYVWEPAGNCVELANAGARLILAPDWQPIVWTEAERKKGQAWGMKTIETFHTHGTPPVNAD
ncbi:hypothetical protein SAMN05421509_103207 [Chromohalobacter canadensis]|uniref:Glyoxalase/Bleomycin resistance protein/Dioxygenase superfamily protein n=1 Tax=Chromohalobacter canadensis TaxID=141389 RepID=A0A285VJK6_9GAMM|nr:hypothetical protein [Chromohalobacter canadensis]SOC54163.1 hypothetical protein SAMN05421509_103207 [Chromohalobacter canadensis]